VILGWAFSSIDLGRVVVSSMYDIPGITSCIVFLVYFLRIFFGFGFGFGTL